MGFSHIITNFYVYCRAKPSAAIGLLVVLIMILSIVGTVFMETKQFSGILAIFLAVDFFCIIGMLPIVTVGSVGYVGDETYKANNQVRSDIAQHGFETNRRVEDWLKDQLRGAGLNVR